MFSIRHALRQLRRSPGFSLTVILDDSIAPTKGRAIDLIALDDAPNGLAQNDPQQSRIVELRFFGGLSIKETAQLLDLSPATMKQYWATTRVWLHREISRAGMTITAQRWWQVRDVLHEAMQMDEQERSAFLDSQCASNPSLRVELNELLKTEGELGSTFLEKPAIACVVARTETCDHSTVLRSGTKLGPYVVQSLIGAGGMGEVYRARDASLKRDVAIKVLPASFSRDHDRLRRFQLEAEAAAALNHPNILSIHAIGQQDGSSYIVTELLEGETAEANNSEYGLCASVCSMVS
jgi:hypothetical protein